MSDDDRLWWLGLDPGRTGAAMALAPDGQPLVLWTWRPRTRAGVVVYEVCIIQPPYSRVEMVATLHDVGVLIRDGMARVSGSLRWRLATEAPHVTGLNPGTGLALAMTIGKLVGPMETNTGPQVLVRPAEWRAEILELPPRTKRDRAKRVSLREIPRKYPAVIALLDCASKLQCTPKAKLDHVTDSMGVGEYARGRGLQAEAEREDEDATAPDSTPKASRRRARSSPRGKGVRAVEGLPGSP